MYKIIFSFLFLATSYSGFSQFNLMLYFEGESYLVPLIQEELKNIICAKSNTKLFDKVTNFNSLDRNVANESRIRGALDFYSNDNLSGFSITDEILESNRILSSSLLNYDYFLSVRINSLNELIEYQFVLYQRIRGIDDEALSVPRLNLIEPISIGNLFVDPRNKEFKNKIVKELRKLFKDCNYIPTFDRIINDKSKTKVHFFSTNDNINIELCNIVDKDNTNDEFVFKWRMINFEIDVGGIEQKYRFDTITKSSFNFQFSSTGTYLIGASIYDGIDVSKEDTITLRIVNQPEIYSKNNDFCYYFLVDPFRSKKAVKVHFPQLDFELISPQSGYRVFIEDKSKLENDEYSLGLTDSMFWIKYSGVFDDYKSKKSYNIYIRDSVNVGSNVVYFNPSIRKRNPIDIFLGGGFHFLSIEPESASNGSTLRSTTIANELIVSYQYRWLQISYTHRFNLERNKIIIDSFQITNQNSISINAVGNLGSSSLNKNRVRFGGVLDRITIRKDLKVKERVALGWGFELERRLFQSKYFPIHAYFGIQNYFAMSEFDQVINRSSFRFGLGYNIFGD